MQRTFVMVKPDGVERGLVGRIIGTFEEAGLKLSALKMMRADRELVQKHYPSTEKWLGIVGGKTIEGYEQVGKNAKDELGTDDPVAIGKVIKEWLVDFIVSGDVVAMIFEGNDAVRNVRRIVGATMPVNADPGSIRGRFSLDSPDAANRESRPVKNLIHASGEPDEAEFEIGLWFPELAN